jgi:putative MATE family efflux protein
LSTESTENTSELESKPKHISTGVILHEGSIIGTLLSLAWPSIVSNTLNVLGPTVDLIWIGKLGADALAAVGVAGSLVMIVNAMMMGVFAGLRSMVSRFIGAKDVQGAVNVVRQAMIISLVIAGSIAIIGIFFSESLLSLLGIAPDVIAEGAGYLRIQFVGMAAMSFRFMLDSTMQASGDTKTPMKLALIFRFFHIVLCPFLIFGWWIFPKLGIAGAAITNVFAQSLGTALGLWILFSGRTHLKMDLKGFRVNFNLIWRLIKIGIPASIMGIQMQLSELIMVTFVAPFGTLAVAGYSLCQRIEMIITMPLFGIGISSGILVGHNLGAKKPERAAKTGWIAAGITEILMVIWAILILLWAEGIIRLFCDDPNLVILASHFLRIAAIGYLFFSFIMVLQQSISGAGDTLPPMLTIVLTSWLIQLPLAYLLPRFNNLGVEGVMWGIAIGMFTAGIINIIYFRSGRWKRKRI